MDDLISRQAAIEALRTCYDTETISMDNGDEYIDYDQALDLINTLPSAQPERKVGKWHITDAYPHNVYCPVCHKKFAQTHWAVWEDGSLPRNFCPNCGADMNCVEFMMRNRIYALRGIAEMMKCVDMSTDASNWECIPDIGYAIDILTDGMLDMVEKLEDGKHE